MPITPFCRIGSKKHLIDLIGQYAPKEFKTYIEPFVGSGAVYLALSNPEVKSYLNDIDPLISDAWKIVKANPPLKNLNKYTEMNLDQRQRFVDRDHSDKLDRLASILYTQAGTFCGVCRGKLYKAPDITKKLKKIPELSEFMKNTKVSNVDWKSLLKHDSSKTFFFLDPPYENHTRTYKCKTIDYAEMANLLSKLKGKFMLTINDSAHIRDTFKAFRIVPFVVPGKAGKIGKLDRRELLILNY